MTWRCFSLTAEHLQAKKLHLLDHSVFDSRWQQYECGKLSLQPSSLLTGTEIKSASLNIATQHNACQSRLASTAGSTKD